MVTGSFAPHIMIHAEITIMCQCMTDPSPRFFPLSVVVYISCLATIQWNSIKVWVTGTTICSEKSLTSASFNV